MGFELSPANIECPHDTQLNIEGSHEFVVYLLDKKNKPVDILGRSAERKLKLMIRQDCKIQVDSVEGSFISYDGFPIKSVFDKADPIPFEVPEENRVKMTLEEKLKAYLAEMVQQRYGQESQEWDTFEESYDFDDEDDATILTGYEVQETQPLEPVQPDPEPEPPPPPVQEEPANPPAEDPPA
jgi:hypothetical protein